MAKQKGLDEGKGLDDEEYDRTTQGNVGGYAKWATPNTSTTPYDPAQEITRAKDSDKKVSPSVSTPAPSPMSEQTSSGNAIKQQTIVDGSSTVTQNTEKYIPGAPGKSAAKMGNDVAIGARQAYFKQHGSYPPCINTNCRSYGRRHDNCLCYGNTSDAGINYGMAKGGVVDGHFCSTNRRHNPKCEYYAEGGDVLEQQAPQQFQDNPEDTLWHAAVEHGLMGLLTDVGHKKLTDPGKACAKIIRVPLRNRIEKKHLRS